MYIAKNPFVGWLAMLPWYIQLYNFYIYFKYASSQYNSFSRYQKTYIHKYMNFSSIAIQAYYKCLWPKSCFYNDCQWLLSVCSSTIVIFTFNMLLVKWKTLFICQKDHIIKIWFSVAIQIWLVIDLYYQIANCEITDNYCLLFSIV